MKKLIYPEIRAVNFKAQDIVTASVGSTTDLYDSKDPTLAPGRRTNIWGEATPDGEGTTRLF